MSGSRRNGRSFVSLPSHDIRRVRRSGSRRRIGGIVLFDAAGAAGPPRVAVTAGKEIGGAVLRNRAKRRLREALDRSAIRHGRDYVVVATREVLDARFEDLITWVTAATEIEEES